MAIEKKYRMIQIKDRKLGDEWIDWHGNLKDSIRDANTKKRVFMSIILMVIFISGALGFILWYLITPRLSQFHPYMPAVFGFILLFLWSTLIFLFFFMVLSIFTGKNFFMRFGGREFPLSLLVPIVFRFGSKFGISQDRLSNSFVKISNILIKTSVQKVKPEKLLILLPRCLQKSIRNKIDQFSNKFHIPVYTVPGGEKARQIVNEIKPKAIIGVACERDLLSGIKDICNQIPIIGIPNIRPEGPCKNTTIDINEFEKAVHTFLGSDITIISTENDE